MVHSFENVMKDAVASDLIISVLLYVNSVIVIELIYHS